jgi:2-polyprenyl-3-methyl-5-hydroxy-6-metoxy-1,4-benzoquinol methylase/uncharacterized protein YbaR (Trm112 family)
VEVSDHWYQKMLICPVDGAELTLVEDNLVSKAGRSYPVVDGVPVMLLGDQRQTIELAHASMDRAKKRSTPIDQSYYNCYVETLGISEAEKSDLNRILRERQAKIDPVVLMLIAATSGYAYRHLIGSLDLQTYPIPALDLPRSDGQQLLDIGCSWGRWSIAAARLGYKVVGIDPSLGAVMAARRITRELGLDINYVVGDGRFLPFPKNAFDCVYSYSVLQHFSNEDARKTIAGVGRVLRPKGMAKIQMANKWGIRSLQHQALRRFREPSGFDVRYYRVGELTALFRELIGQTRISTDCYFGLGWQWSDFDYMPISLQSILIASETLKRLSNVIPPMRYIADSVFLTAVKPARRQF